MTSIKNNLLIRRLEISFNFILYLSLLLKYFCAFPIQFCDVKILTLGFGGQIEIPRQVLIYNRP